MKKKDRLKFRIFEKKHNLPKNSTAEFLRFLSVASKRGIIKQVSKTEENRNA